MLKENMIEPVQLEMSLPVVFVVEKDETPLFCVDYRSLDPATVRDPYRSPRKEEWIDSLREAQVFSTMVSNPDYLKIRVDKEVGNKRAFSTHHGLYQFKRMPFGLKNVPTKLQRPTEVILSLVERQYNLL